MKPLLLAVLLSVGMLGCQKKEAPKPELRVDATAGTTEYRTLTDAQKVADRAFLKDGIHPAVRREYYEQHPHAFSCHDDPYACKECPVGSPDRIITIPERSKSYDVPAEINAWFACGDINRLIPERERVNGRPVWDDTFLCEREPQDGFVVVDGRKFSCSETTKGTQRQHLGDLQPGESKSVTIIPK